MSRLPFEMQAARPLPFGLMEPCIGLHLKRCEAALNEPSTSVKKYSSDVVSNIR